MVLGLGLALGLKILDATIDRSVNPQDHCYSEYGPAQLIEPPCEIRMVAQEGDYRDCNSYGQAGFQMCVHTEELLAWVSGCQFSFQGLR